MWTTRAAAALLAVTCLGSSAGCAPRLHRAAPPVASPGSPMPAPTVTVLKTARTLAAGATADFTAQQGVGLRLTASRPRVSRTRLSSSYGYGPARGYYVTFVLTIVNTGSRTVLISPSDFVVRIPGEGRVTTVEGNAPYSGASAELDRTALDPQQRVRAPVTFDVRRPSGTLAFVPDGSAALIWRF